MELGPLQKAWIKSLREHPERQMKSVLGEKFEDGHYTACCLGEAGLISGVCHWFGNHLISRVPGRYEDPNTQILKTPYHVKLRDETYTAMGLRGPIGPAKSDGSFSLAKLNDEMLTWPEIADLLEKDPDNYFTESK